MNNQGMRKNSCQFIRIGMIKVKYKKFGKTGLDVSVLGFGCMRLPLSGPKPTDIDEEKSIAMIRHSIDSGVNYIDTAYPYHGGQSELLVAKALKNGYRDKVYLATKFPTWLQKDASDFDRFLDEQLKKLETDHIDMYLLHGLDAGRWERLKTLGVFDALARYKASGRVKHIGFSFHDKPEAFTKIIDEYDHWEFCQVQFNYMDEHEQAGIEGIEYAASKGIAVIVMEPIRGGGLSKTPPDVVQKLWDSAPVSRTPAEWALRWVWNHPQVSLLLSGMSAPEQVEENLKVADSAEAGSLTDEELALFPKVRDAYKSLSKVGCTGCEYCMPCQFGVNIPRNFALYNDAFIYDDINGKSFTYKTFFTDKERASNCQECGQCETVCPQKLPIRKLLKDVDALLKA